MGCRTWKRQVLAGGVLCLALMLCMGHRTYAARRNVFIGDSRTVGMYLYALGNTQRNTVRARDSRGDIWCASVGQGYHWMVNSGAPWAESYIDANTNVVILIGANDVSEQSWNRLYIDYINEKALEWKLRGARCYFVSIGPVREDRAGVTEAGILARNQALFEGLSDNVTYINTYDFLKENATFTDYIHYSPSCSKLYYDYLINVLETDEAMIAYFDAIGEGCQGTCAVCGGQIQPAAQ